MNKLKIKLEEHLNRRISHFVIEHLQDHNLDPTVENVAKISESDIECSWLSVPSMYEFMFYQQQLNNDK